MTTRTALLAVKFIAILSLTCRVLASANLLADESEAYIGQPVGVARVSVNVFRGEPSLPLQDERFTISDQEDRAIYAVVKEEPARQFLRGILGLDTPRTVTLYFLFRGDEPLDVSVYSPVEQGMRITPKRDPQGHQRLMQEWWQQTTERWVSLQKDPQFPPVAENFLVASFARRLKQPLPEVGAGLLGLRKQKLSAIEELFGGEAALLAIDRDLLMRGAPEPPKLEPLPNPPTWSELAVEAKELEKVAVEPLAAHVPEECFYLRFGNFTNYFWFRDLSSKWDGDFKNMVLRRAIRPRATERIEQQLSLKENALSRILGPQFISDAALIGLDPYMRNGAAIGLLVQARNSEFLSQDFMRQRRAALTEFPEAQESTIQLAGKDVSLVATPDGRVRSYYAQAGDFHLVTTSRHLAERFLEIDDQTGSLAALGSFRLARQKLPLDRDDTIFGFISERFVQNLCSPAMWIESRRRQESARVPHLIRMAQLAAECEGLPARTTSELIAAQLLPIGFGVRGDGSPRAEDNPEALDAIRGATGFFAPVSDVEVQQISPEESAAYRKFIANFQEEVGQFPPIALGLKRRPHAEKDLTRALDLDVIASPLGKVKLGTLVDSLGDPVEEQLHPVAGDVIAAEVSLEIPVPLVGGEKQPHLLFGGIRDFSSPLAVRQGKIVGSVPRSELIRGYIGTWPRPGILELLQDPSLEPGTQPQPLGEQMWQAQEDKFLLISFKPDVIQEVRPQLAFEPAPRPAQVRLRIDDLTGKQLATTVNALGYMRARDTSVAPSRMMNSLANLLHVPRDTCREFAEELVDGTFVCPLNGEYQLFEIKQGLPVWASSALPGKNRFLLTEVPEDFHLSFLDWFRGVTGDLCVTDSELAAHLELEMAPTALP